MAGSLSAEMQRITKMIGSCLDKANNQPNSKDSSLSTRDLSVSIPDNSFIKRWKASDKIFEGKFSSSGNSSPRTPSSPIPKSQNTPATIKRYPYDSSDGEDFLFTNRLEISRYSYDFEELQEIGGGSFGRVYRCRHNLDKIEYAVKKIFIKNKSESAKERAIQEAYTLATSSSLDDNSYIIKYHTAWIEKSHLYLIMELCDCSLSEYMLRVGELDENSLKKIFRDICKGLKKLHKHNIVHLDIKPENILFSFNHKFKIGDLGLARITTNISGEIPEGDSRYLASELINIISNDSAPIPDLTKADIFALGCTMLEIMNSKPLPSKGPLWHDIRNGDYEITGNYSQQFKDIVRKMLYKDPEKRPSAKQILKDFLLSKTREELKIANNYIKFLLNPQRVEVKLPEKRRKLSL